MPSIGAPELLIILAIVVVLFGASRLSGLGKSLGRGIKEFRDELKDDDAPKKTETTVTTVTEEKKPSQSH